MRDINNTKKKKILLDISPEDMEIIKQASEKDMRSQRNFIVSSAINRAKELTREVN